MNTIRRYAADDAHVIYGTAYDEGLGDQLRVTVIATGLSPAKRVQQSTPMSVVHSALRTGTDNLPIMSATSVPGAAGSTPQSPSNDYSQLIDAERLAPRPHAGCGQGRRAGQQRHGRDRDPGFPAQAGGLIEPSLSARPSPASGRADGMRGSCARCWRAAGVTVFARCGTITPCCNSGP